MANARTGFLDRCRVLVVEDEFYIADDMAAALTQLGAEVVGPAPSKETALAILSSESPIHAAVLDINLKGQAVFPVADALTARGVPFVFASGYGPAMLPNRFRAVPLFEKPFNPRDLATALPLAAIEPCRLPGE